MTDRQCSRILLIILLCFCSFIAGLVVGVLASSEWKGFEMFSPVWSRSYVNRLERAEKRIDFDEFYDMLEEDAKEKDNLPMVIPVRIVIGGPWCCGGECWEWCRGDDGRCYSSPRYGTRVRDGKVQFSLSTEDWYGSTRVESGDILKAPQNWDSILPDTDGTVVWIVPQKRDYNGLRPALLGSPMDREELVAQPGRSGIGVPASMVPVSARQASSRPVAKRPRRRITFEETD